MCRIGSGAVPFLLPLLFQLQLGYAPFHSGLMLLPIAIAGTISKRWIVPLVNRFGYDMFLLVNTWVVGVSIASFAAMSPGWPMALSILQLAVFGCANSMQFAAMNSVTLKGLSREDAGSGNSLFSMVQMLAIGLGVTIGGGLVSLFSVKLGMAAPAYRLAFLSMGLVTVLSGLVFRCLDASQINPQRGKREAVQAR
ncbi:putative multidrug resistance protein MdtD [compost metagenome]